MTKTNSVRNIVLAIFFGLVVVYTLWHLTGGRVQNNKDVLTDREQLLQQVDNERTKQESDDLVQIQNDLDQTDFETLPQ